ncbi:MAG: radical SAM protein [Candidatus Yanofskybacteria bacterium]|nr:radical SAM protein [Candidatus Yanofskybacteria bacterium]
MSSQLQIVQPNKHSSPDKKSLHPADVIKDIKPKDLEGLNVVFINMPLRETAVPNVTPEGPLLMATNLRKNYGVAATIIDLNAYRIKDTPAQRRGLPNGRHLTLAEAEALIRKHFQVYGEPDVVALSGMITTLRWQEEVSKVIRKILPDVFLVSGGGLATDLKIGLFAYIPELDAVAHSEGDDVIIKICYDAKMIKQHGLFSSTTVDKLRPYYIGELFNKHRLIYAGNRPQNLDALPFADLSLLEQDVNGYRILDMYLHNPVWGASANNSSATPFTMLISTTSVSSRGCPFACNYCDRQAQGEKNWGIRSAEHIYVEMLHHLEKYGIDSKGFPDDNFAVAIPRIEKMVPLLGPLKIPWGTHTRMDEGADPRRIKPMAQAGCYYIGFGPESANPKDLESINKGGHTLSNGLEECKVLGRMYKFPRSMTVATRNCLEFGIHANCTWIMGIPGQTLESLKDTVAFMKWQEEKYTEYGIPAEAVNKRMFTLTAYPTELMKLPIVQSRLHNVFGLNFDSITHMPICDDSFHNYCLELDDATKIMHDPKTGEPLNYSDIPMDQFLQARELVDSGQTLKILDM